MAALPTIEIETAKLLGRRSLLGFGLIGAAAFATTPGGRKLLRRAAVVGLAAGMAAREQLQQFGATWAEIRREAQREHETTFAERPADASDDVPSATPNGEVVGT